MIWCPGERGECGVGERGVEGEKSPRMLRAKRTVGALRAAKYLRPSEEKGGGGEGDAEVGR